MPHGQHNPHKPHPEPSIALALEAALLCRLDRVADALERMAEAVEALAPGDTAERIRTITARLDALAPNTPSPQPQDF